AENLLVTQADHVLEVALDHRERMWAREGRIQPVGDAVRLDRYGLARGEGPTHGIRIDRLDAVDASAGSLLPDRSRDARDQPSAADADDDHIDLREVLEDLEPRRAMA